MNRYIYLILLLFGSTFFVACGGDVAEPTEDVGATVTAAVMTAIAENKPATNTPEPAQQETLDTVEPTTELAPTTETLIDTPIPTEETAVNAPTTEPTVDPTTIPVTESPTCRTVQGLNIRRGPGTDYNPPLRQLPVNETLIPRAFHAFGFPSGQWVFVDVANTGETGWVSAGSAFITCNINVDSLPTATNITPPPTQPPPPTNTPVPPVVASGPPQLSNVATGGEDVQDFDSLVFQPQLNNHFLLRIDARNSTLSDSKNGDGVSHVTFFVSLEGGGEVYSHQENTAGYCIFRGGEPDCRPWPQNSNGRYTWGEGGPEVQPGRYRIDVTVFNEDGSTFNWNTRFDVAVP